MRNKAFLLLLLFCKTMLFMWEKMHYENHSRTLLIPRGLKPKVTERQFIAKTCKNIGKHVQANESLPPKSVEWWLWETRIRTCFHFCYPPTVLTSIQNSIVVRDKNNQIFSSYILNYISKKLQLPYFSSSIAILSEWQEKELEFWTVIFDTLETLKRKQERKEEGV